METVETVDWDKCKNCNEEKCIFYRTPKQKFDKHRKEVEYKKLQEKEKYYWDKYQEQVKESIRRKPHEMKPVIERCQIYWKEYRRFSDELSNFQW